MRMIPSIERLAGLESTAEQRVAELLSQARLDLTVACLYSVHLPEHEYKRMAEADFVVVWDDVVLVVEVKGGRVDRHDGSWSYTNRYGQTNDSREGPFGQARTAMFALQRRLEATIPLLDVAFGYLVITPQQELPGDLEWAPAQHAGPRTMTVSGLEKVLKEARDHALTRTGRAVRGGAYRDLMRVLRPDFDLVPTIGSHGPGLEAAYVRLAERQYDLLTAAERNARILCLGGAGSGKTLLAVETARRASAAGDRVLLTCHSPALARVLQEALLSTSATAMPLADVPDAEPFDLLVVDEGQDLMNDEAVLRLDELVRGGLSTGRWRFFCDPNNQANVDGSFDRRTLDELASGAVTIDLPYNCRNTVAVVQQTQLLTGADLGVARAGEGPAVEYERCPDVDATARLLDARLKRLRREGVDASDVVVVTVLPDIRTSSAQATRALRTGRLAPSGTPVAGTDVVRFVTSAEFKGLEAQHVCVIDVDDVLEPLARARLYVAMTRPRVSLWMALNERAWDQMADPTKDQGVR